MSALSNVTGPLFTVGEAVTDEFAAESVKRVAQEGKEQLLNYLGDRLRNPTGYYESNITWNSTGHYSARIHDNQVIYGPWLEGISSRNQSTSFEGYHSAEDTREYLEGFGPQLANELLVGRFLAMLR